MLYSFASKARIEPQESTVDRFTYSSDDLRVKVQEVATKIEKVVSQHSDSFKCTVKGLLRVVEFNIQFSTPLTVASQKQLGSSLKSYGMVLTEPDEVRVTVNRWTVAEVGQMISSASLKDYPLPKLPYLLEKLKDISTRGKELPFCVGVDIYGDPVVVDANQMMHIGFAGMSQYSGKTNTILQSILTMFFMNESRDNFDVWIIDPTEVLSVILKKYVKETAGLEGSIDLLERVEQEIIFRRELLTVNGCLHVKDLPKEKQPKTLIVVIEELRNLRNEISDIGGSTRGESIRKLNSLMTKLESIISIAAKLRVYLWVCTQYGNKDTLGSSFHSNLSNRCVHYLNSPLENTSIWGNADRAAIGNATKLTGYGDFFIGGGGTNTVTRCHSVYVTPEDVLNFFEVRLKWHNS